MGKRTYGGYYSPSFTAKKARKMGMSYRYKKRRTSSKKGTYTNNQRGVATNSLYKTRRLPYRSYKRKVYESLMFKESNRSYASATTTLTPTVTNAQKAWFTYRVPENFYLTAGGYPGAETFSTEKIIIKGGTLTVTLRNDMTDNIIIDFGRLRIRNSEGEFEVDGITPQGFDISNFESFGTGFKLSTKMRRVVIGPNETHTMSMHIPFTIINDLNQWTEEGRNRELIVFSIFPQAAGALNVVRTISHNLTFVADAIDTA